MVRDVVTNAHVNCLAIDIFRVHLKKQFADDLRLRLTDLLCSDEKIISAVTLFHALVVNNGDVSEARKNQVLERFCAS